MSHANKKTPNKKDVKLSLADLQEKLDIQQKLIESLISASADREGVVRKFEDRVRKLERDQTMNEALLVMKDRVQTLLSKRITQLEQYTRRYSVVIKGIDREFNEKPDDLRKKIQAIIDKCESSTTFEEIDKYHRNGKREGKTQEVIVRFKSHSAKEAFYKKRKTIKNDIKVQPSLSPSTKQQLEEAKELIKTYQVDAIDNPPDFVMADMHGNLQVKMKKETKHGLFFRFESPDQLCSLISKCNASEEADVRFDENRAVEVADDAGAFGSMDDLLLSVMNNITCGDETLALNLSA